MIKWSWHIIDLIAIITICHCKLTGQTNTDSLVIEYQIADDDATVPDQGSEMVHSRWPTLQFN